MTGAELRAARRTIDLTQEQLGHLLGLTGNTISRMERGAAQVERRVELAVEHLSTLGSEALDLRLAISGRCGAES